MRRTVANIPAAILVILGVAASPTRGEITAEKSDRGAVVKIDGQPFCEYLTLSGHMPAIWPVIGPTGKAMTRSYPAGPRVTGETNDHPHHHSIWFTHGEVNHLDFWTHDRGKPDNRIVHRDFVTIASGPEAKIVTRNDWIADGGKKICEDERTILFGKRENGDRWIDFSVKLTASEGDVTFGETKEGTFGVRAADAITLNAKKGGKLSNSRGESDRAAWGRPAEWIDDTGPIEGDTVGIAMMSHPTSFRPLTRWHVRDYGLLAANPFGEREFFAEGGPRPADGKPLQGEYKLEKGQSLTFRYLVLLHKGTPEEAHVADVFRDFAAIDESPAAPK